VDAEEERVREYGRQTINSFKIINYLKLLIFNILNYYFNNSYYIMNTIITFVILMYFIYLIYNIIIYYKDDTFRKNCKNKIVYMPIPNMMIDEFNLNN